MALAESGNAASLVAPKYGASPNDVTHTHAKAGGGVSSHSHAGAIGGHGHTANDKLNLADVALLPMPKNAFGVKNASDQILETKGGPGSGPSTSGNGGISSTKTCSDCLGRGVVSPEAPMTASSPNRVCPGCEGTGVRNSEFANNPKTPLAAALGTKGKAAPPEHDFYGNQNAQKIDHPFQRVPDSPTLSDHLLRQHAVPTTQLKSSTKAHGGKTALAALHVGLHSSTRSAIGGKAMAEVDSTKCSACDAGNASDAKCCDQCGAKMVPTSQYSAGSDETNACPACGKMNADDAKCCDQCGAKMSSGKEYRIAASLIENGQIQEAAKYLDIIADEGAKSASLSLETYLMTGKSDHLRRALAILR